MSAGAARLAQMANQIARFFDSQSGDPAAQTLQHLRSYWAPTMRRDLVDLLRGGGEGLGPTAYKAAELLAEDQGDAHAPAAPATNPRPHG